MNSASAGTSRSTVFAGTKSTARLRKNPGKQELIEFGRQRRGGGVDRGGIAPQGDGHGHALSEGFIGTVMLRPHLVRMPMHPRRLPIVHLHPIHADVTQTGLGMLRDDKGQRDESPAILRPALENRQRVERRRVFDHFLAGRVLHRPRRPRGHLRQFRQGPQLLDQRFRHLSMHERGDPRPDFVEVVHAQGERGSRGRAEEIDDQRILRALGVREPHRRPPGAHQPIRDLGDLETGSTASATSRSSPRAARAVT